MISLEWRLSVSVYAQPWTLGLWTTSSTLANPGDAVIVPNTTGKHFKGANDSVIEKYGSCDTILEGSEGGRSDAAGSLPMCLDRSTP